MDRGGILSVLVVLGLAGVATILVVSQSGLFAGGSPVDADCEGVTTDAGIETGGEYDRTTVTLLEANGTKLGAVDVRIADTEQKRYTGLSNTGSLAEDEGMLFVHDRERQYTYVMRRMDFPLDVVFVDANHTITTIQHAPVPEEIQGGNGQFPGYGQYVLEVDRGWTNATGVDVGDCVAIPENLTAR